MTISITELKARLFEIVREIERHQAVVNVERHGRVVARIVPATPISPRPWEALHGTGRLLAAPEESVLADADVWRERPSP